MDGILLYIMSNEVKRQTVSIKYDNLTAIELQQCAKAGSNLVILNDIRFKSIKRINILYMKLYKCILL